MKTSGSVPVKLVLDCSICVIIIAFLVFSAVGATAPSQALPQPHNGIRFIVSTFDRVPIVALGGGSDESQDEDKFVLDLMEAPRFSASVRNVAIECGNSRYQEVLDSYVAGAEVPLDRVQLAWRNTTQVFGCKAAQQKAFVQAVRELNRHLPADRRLRLLAGDPPIDWAKVRTAADVKFFLRQRNTNFAAVVEEQVLAKHQKALLLTGDFHVFKETGLTDRSTGTVTMLLERKHPRSTYIIVPHHGFGDRNGELEPLLASWPTPSIATLRNTWLGRLNPFLIYNDIVLVSNPSKVVDPFPGRTLQDLADAYLYLGPLAASPEVPEETDAAYARVIAQRQRLMGGGQIHLAPAPTPTR